MSYFIIYVINLQKNEYKIKYNDKEFPLEDKINIKEKINEKCLEIDLLSDKDTKHFTIELSEDFLNQIVLDLDKSTNNKFNIELFTLNYNIYKDTDILLQKGSEKITLKIPENNLGIGKINILNSDLNFKLYIKEIILETSITNENENISSKDTIFKFLGKKNINMRQYYEQNKEILFEIDNKDIYGKVLRFCLHILEDDHIITVHNMEEKIGKIDIEIVSKEDLENLENKIISKISELKEEVKCSELNKINFEIIDDKYNENIILYRFQNKEFEEKHFLAFIHYCYKYLCHFIKNIIKKLLKTYSKEFGKYVDFGKNIINEILSKFEYFNEYYKYIMEKENNIDNLVINKKNLTFQEKADILSSILTIIINSPSFSTDKKIEFFELRSNNKNVYLDALNFLSNIIDNLKSKSILNKGYLKTLSRVKIDINKKNKKNYGKDSHNVFLIELINLDDLKKKLKAYLLNMIVRYYNSKSKTAAEYDIFSGNIILMN